MKTTNNLEFDAKWKAEEMHRTPSNIGKEGHELELEAKDNEANEWNVLLTIWGCSKLSG